MSGSRYEARLRWQQHRSGREPVASVLYLEGRCHFVDAGGQAERDLIADGALAIGHVRFDAPPGGGPVVALPLEHWLPPGTARDRPGSDLPRPITRAEF